MLICPLHTHILNRRQNVNHCISNSAIGYLHYRAGHLVLIIAVLALGVVPIIVY